MSDIRLCVHVWLDVENTILGVSRQSFMKRVRSAGWSRKRMRIFRDFTLRSLMNQDLDNFDILLFLNPRFKKIHDEFDLPDRVIKRYDDGKKWYTKEIDSDYVIVMRIDSDDLFREDMLEKVVIGAKFDKEKRTCRVWKKVIQWNAHHKFISNYTLPRSPFCAHVFPRKVYSNWERMKVEQFMDYKSCPDQPQERLICIVRHGGNVTFPRIGKNMYSRRYYEEEMIKRNGIVRDPVEMRKILKRFGIPKEMVNG